MRLGLISDTHDHFDRRLPEVFAGVDRILHAGDICSHRVLTQLEAIAPVTAVLGNNDYGMCLQDFEVVEAEGQRFLLHHIVQPDRPVPELQRRIQATGAQVVLFGHSHEPFDETRRAVRFVNPGYAGKPRFNLPRSVALMDIARHGTKLRYIELQP